MGRVCAQPATRPTKSGVKFLDLLPIGEELGLDWSGSCQLVVGLG